jgi:hypothetical protein
MVNPNRHVFTMIYFGMLFRRTSLKNRQTIIFPRENYLFDEPLQPNIGIKRIPIFDKKYKIYEYIYKIKELVKNGKATYFCVCKETDMQ